MDPNTFEIESINSQACSDETKLPTVRKLWDRKKQFNIKKIICIAMVSKNEYPNVLD